MEKIKGKSKMREYKLWEAMKSRCYSPSHTKGNYKKKNITVCDAWRNCFEQFYEDLGPCPDKKCTLDRIDNDQGYFKENCRWTDWSTQSKNRGDFNKLFTYNGTTKVLKDWAREFDIKYTTLYNRIYRSNKSFEEAIQKDPFNKLLKLGDEEKTMKDWCTVYNMEFKLVNNRINKHKWSLEDALNIPKGTKRKIKI